VSVNAFVRDDSHLQDTKNWKTYSIENGKTHIQDVTHEEKHKYYAI